MVTRLQGASFIHARPIGFHGALSEFKCLINSRFVLRIADLGMSQLKANLSAGTYHEMEEDCLDKLFWVAPEILRDGVPPSQATDIYAIGILLYQITVWTEPYDHDTYVRTAAG